MSEAGPTPAPDDELWKALRVGDRVRVIQFPQEFLMHGTLQAETKVAYEYLLRRRSPLTVWKIDKSGLPWVKFRLRGEDGRMENHFMALNHSGLSIAKRKPE